MMINMPKLNTLYIPMGMDRTCDGSKFEKGWKQCVDAHYPWLITKLPPSSLVAKDVLDCMVASEEKRFRR
jgi:hypothetical protein